MRQLSIRLTVALVAFVVGVTFAWAFGAVFGRAAGREAVREVYVAPRVMKARSCPTKSLGVEAPPAVEAPRQRKRVVIRRADGAVQVVETQTGSGAKE